MKDMRALSIRQPYAEQILRGLKTIEYRSRPTKVRGRIYLYAALRPGDEAGFRQLGVRPGELPVGVIVGTVEITDCTGASGNYQWRLARPRRLRRQLKPHNHPQPVWFHPFRRQQGDSQAPPIR